MYTRQKSVSTERKVLDSGSGIAPVRTAQDAMLDRMVHAAVAGEQTPFLDSAASQRLGTVHIGTASTERRTTSDGPDSYTQELFSDLDDVDAQIEERDAAPVGDPYCSYRQSLKLGGRRRISAQGRKKAVLVGNSGYRSPHMPLYGVKPDLRTATDHIAADQVVVHENLGAADIARAYEQGLDGLGPGDHLTIYFAGHGVPAGLVGVDSTALDKGIYEVGTAMGLMRRARGQGLHLTAIFDACYAGTFVEAARKDRIDELSADPTLPPVALATLPHLLRLEALRGEMSDLEGMVERARKTEQASVDEASELVAMTRPDWAAPMPGEGPRRDLAPTSWRERKAEESALLGQIWDEVSGIAVHLERLLPELESPLCSREAFADGDVDYRSAWDEVNELAAAALHALEQAIAAAR